MVPWGWAKRLQWEQGIKWLNLTSTAGTGLMDVRAAGKSCSVVLSSCSLSGPGHAAFLPVPEALGQLTAVPVELPVPARLSVKGDCCSLFECLLWSVNIFRTIES